MGEAKNLHRLGRSPKKWLIGLILISIGVTGVLALCIFWRPSPLAPEREVEKNSKIPEAVEPPPPRPVPGSMKGAWEEIGRLQAQGQFAEAARGYGPFLDQLGRKWGEGSEDLAPYAYNHALAVKLAGRPQDSIALASRYRDRWPLSLQLLMLEATGRAAISSAAGVYDERADRLFQKLLEESQLPGVRGLQVDPAALFAQWGNMRSSAGRVQEALQAIERGLACDPAHRGCREIQARLLLTLQESRQALAILEPLDREGSTPPIKLYLGMARLDSGDAASAWQAFSGLVAERPGGFEPGADWASFGSVLSLKAAKALNELGRPREAAELLLEPLLLEPEHPEALQQLSASARALGAAAAFEALIGRSRQLAPAEDFRQSAQLARRTGHPGSAAFYQAQAHLVTQQTGRALKALEEGLRAAPKLLPLHLERARVLLLLGKVDLAERGLAEAYQRLRAPVLLAERARVLAERGRRGEARQLLSQEAVLSSSSIPAGAAGEERWSSEKASVRRARALLELGDAESAAALLSKIPLDGEHREEAILCRAEAAMRSGRKEEALELLAESFQSFPGGAEWARALKSALGEGSAAEPSDLLDHPRLLRTADPLQDLQRRRGRL